MREVDMYSTVDNAVKMVVANKVDKVLPRCAARLLCPVYPSFLHSAPASTQPPCSTVEHTRPCTTFYCARYGFSHPMCVSWAEGAQHLLCHVYHVGVGTLGAAAHAVR